MTNTNHMMEAIQLLQHHKVKGKKLSLWHYALDYSLTALFLSAYIFAIYSIINFIL